MPRAQLIFGDELALRSDDRLSKLGRAKLIVSDTWPSTNSSLSVFVLEMNIARFQAMLKLDMDGRKRAVIERLPEGTRLELGQHLKKGDRSIEAPSTASCRVPRLGRLPTITTVGNVNGRTQSSDHSAGTTPHHD